MRILICFLFTLAAASCFAQANDKGIDSLHHLLLTEQRDSVKARLYFFLGQAYRYRLTKIDSALFYYQKSLDLNRKLNSPLQVFPAKGIANIYNFNMGNYSAALQLLQQNLKLEEQLHDTNDIFYTKREVMWIYGSIGDYQKELELAKALDSFATSGYFKDPKNIAFYKQVIYYNLADIYFNLNQPDSALRYRLLYYDNAKQRKDTEELALAVGGLVELYTKTEKLDSAFYYNRLWFLYAAESGRLDMLPEAQMRMAYLFQKTAQFDSAFQYAYRALHAYQDLPDTAGMMKTALLLSELYKKQKRFDSAFTYLSYYTLLKDSSLREDKIKKVQTLMFNESMRQKELEQERKEAQRQYAAKVKLYSLLAGIGVLLLLAAVLYRNNQQKQKAKTEIEKAYNDLKATQAQLIQSEKMASLGELTAGIAHEIQNPLNFVNNFSDTNAELLEESLEALTKGDYEEVKALIVHSQANEVKINYHGRRADAIVKSMLEHSRTAKGERQLTNINALTEEYLRLAYHGFRAKDKSFNAAIQTHYDESIGKVNIVPQDIGRVLLNLFNNAFYAINEKRKQADDSYEPTTIVSTQKLKDKIEIRVQDNGNGIPQKVADKVFQPFFTTKPTGEGTGLGLSLSYDIIKAHGGDVRVESTEGEGAAFIISLPV